jgi:tetratricopeptide (TPR) repeat protein
MTTITCLFALLFASLPAHAADADDPPGVWLAEARSLARHGDTAGARQSAAVALEMPGDHQRQAQLLIGATYELEGRLDEALALYEALADAYPRKDVPVAIRLRLATAHGKQQSWGKAKRALRPLLKDATLPPDRQLQAHMLRGLWDLDRGKDARGLARVAEALEMPAASPWWRAQGHEALFDYALELARTYPAGRTPEALQEALQTRAELVAMAQQQTVHLIRLDQADTARRALLGLADLHEQTGLDVLTITQDPADPRVAGLWVRALGYVERGQELARRTGADVAVLADLDARRGRLEARIEAL